jgi:hypothetical protein
MRKSVMTTAAIALALGALIPQPALSWGVEGHEIVAQVVRQAEPENPHQV